MPSERGPRGYGVLHLDPAVPAPTRIPVADCLRGAGECQTGIGPNRHDASVIKDCRHGRGADVWLVAGAEGSNTASTMLGRRGVHEIDAAFPAFASRQSSRITEAEPAAVASPCIFGVRALFAVKKMMVFIGSSYRERDAPEASTPINCC